MNMHEILSKILDTEVVSYSQRMQNGETIFECEVEESDLIHDVYLTTLIEWMYNDLISKLK